ncbi:C6 zinc finger domain protein [Sclerotinia borealis F-4128]|uniref:C6 zinc finger domain protein n=1 Tax=Sclerotinia borealis (strain F-4128) TaxID=1432307 RepID=W9CBP8_SCLBF|nr:C6 zinc finger domain protein [Sclerotinia borealis F-4128]
MSSNSNSRSIRSSKACERCRRRKIKCNGQTPCQVCRQQTAQCNYRLVNRRRKSKWSPPPDTDGGMIEHPSDIDELQESGQQCSSTKDNNTIFTEIHHGISAIHDAPGSCTTQLSYGPSSNFSFMNQIHRCLSTSKSETPLGSRDDEVSRAAEKSLEFLGHKAHSFGTERDATTETGLSKSNSELFLSLELAETFLSHFLSTIYHLFPATSAVELLYMVKQLFNRTTTARFDPMDETFIMTILALGASLTERIEWAETIFDEIKIKAAVLDETVNSCMGRSTSAYFHLGKGVRKALALGLHKDSNSSKGASGAPDQTLESNLTMWSLYFFESWTSYGEGRPSSLNMNDISIPYPEDTSYMSALIQLAKIMSRSTLKLYSQEQTSLLAMWTEACNIHKELEAFAHKTKKHLQIGLDDPVHHGQVNVHQVLLSNLYHHILVLTFRPFLIFHVVWQRRLTSESSSDEHLETITSASEVEWLIEACQRASDAARSWISSLRVAMDANPLLWGLRYMGFYVESACYLLIYDTIRDMESAMINISFINAGLRCLSQILPGDTVSSAIVTIRKMVAALQQKYPSQYQASENIPTAAVPLLNLEHAIIHEVSCSMYDDLDEVGLIDFDLTSIGWNFDHFVTDLDGVALNM